MKRLALVLAAVAMFSMSAMAQHIEFKWHGFYGVATFDYATNLNKTVYSDEVSFDGYSFMGFTAVAGYSIRKETAFGIGCSFMKDPTGAFSQLPIFAEVRGNFLRSRITPFAALQVGYTLPLGSSSGGKNSIEVVQGGVMSCVNAGVRFAITRKLGVNLYVGYQMLNMSQVERKIEGKHAVAQPVLFQNVKFGGGVNF